MSSNSSDTSRSIEDEVPQAVVCVGAVILLVAIGALVAKLAEMWHDRLSLRDDSSEMSEHTKQLLQQRVLQMFSRPKKVQTEQSKLELAKKYAQQWRYQIAMRKRRLRRKSIKHV